MDKRTWEIKELGNICQVLDSQRKPVTKSERCSGIYPYYGATGIQDFVDSYLFDGRYLLIGEDGAKWGAMEQSAYIIEGKSWVNNHVHIIKPNDNTIDSYLMYYLNFSNLDNYITGAIVRKLTQAALKQIRIPIPNIETQKSIVEELDDINKAIKNIKDQIQDLELLAQSTFIEMFGDPVSNEKQWEVCSLNSLSSAIGNGNTPKGGREVYVKEGILFLRSQNVWKNRIDLDDVAYIDEVTHQSLKRSALRKNDLLITKTGRINTENSSLGRTALYTGEDGMANLNGHVYFVRLKEGVRHKFVLYILISNSYRDLIRRTCVGGIDKRQLNKNHIEDFPIIMPPVEMQDKYINIIEDIEKSKEELNKSLKDMEILLASRMQCYFE